MIHTFQTIARIISGNGAVQSIAREVHRVGATQALILTSTGLVRRKTHLPIVADLKTHGISATVFARDTAEPCPADAEDCAAAARSCRADVIIGLGGGSILDCAKAAAVLTRHPGPIEKYFGQDLVPGPCMPTILIPTTAGTGSEVTSIAVLEDKHNNAKKAIVSDYLYAKAAILDPELTVSMPSRITASTGMDAFVHAMESYVNRTATTITDGLNLQAMRCIARSIRTACADGQHLTARADMLYASALAGMGFSNTQNGVIHAIAMAAPAEHHLPHGLLVAAVAPMGIMFNCQAAPEKYAHIAEILGCDPQGKTPQECAGYAACAMKDLVADLGITPGLAAHGIKRAELRGIAERAAAARRLMDNNPRQGTADDLHALLEEYF
ncbi:MAG: iron-containing alcohol dehydrogenase [Desulfovibrionales bacterium]|nr:iron-containing alcohol dehydrogenase [Desulfovibrionales bacterium]